ncbi:MAG: hypothetical protein KatS3mg129_2203 [Leptospiraceae bacterium]|nr:MAG: hypothetical protein KatS3mg129_2203 [Leptospiraceae bacterium]
MKTTQSLYHPKYGKVKKIIKEWQGGIKMLIEFESGQQKNVLYNELRPYYFKKINVKSFNKNPLQIRKYIESLRYGLLNDELIFDITFDRKKEIETFYNWLTSSKSTLFLCGKYGTGKTHFLKYIGLWALSKNWAVSYICLDGEEVSLHNPKKFYQSIINNLKFIYNDEVQNIEHLLEYIYSRAEKYKDNYFFGNIKDKDLYVIKKWLKGEEEYDSLPKLRDHQTSGNIYSYLITSISLFLKKEFSLNGLLILMDESENIQNHWLNSYQNSNENNFLRGFYYAVSNHPDLEEDIVSISAEVGKYGKKTHLRYNGYLPLPFSYKNESYIKLVFALPYTSIEVKNNYIIKNKIGRIPVIEYLSNKHRGIKELIDIIKDREFLDLEEIDIFYYKYILKKIIYYYFYSYNWKPSFQQIKKIINILKTILYDYESDFDPAKIRLKIQAFIINLDKIRNEGGYDVN